MPHPAESGDRSRGVHVAGSDLTDYPNPPRLGERTNRCFTHFGTNSEACALSVGAVAAAEEDASWPEDQPSLEGCGTAEAALNGSSDATPRTTSSMA